MAGLDVKTNLTEENLGDFLDRLGKIVNQLSKKADSQTVPQPLESEPNIN